MNILRFYYYLRIYLIVNVAFMIPTLAVASCNNNINNEVKVGAKAGQTIATTIKWHWEESFSIQEKEKLMRWISQVMQGVERNVTAFPFDVHIFFYHQKSSSSPAPWAHTQRGKKQGIHFYVDTSFSYEDFINDWTAPHEIAHLLLPYLGKENGWYAEGFASYMQFQVMKSMGVMTAKEVARAYKTRIDKVTKRYDLDHMPFEQAVHKLLERRDYPGIYWGAAIYFYNADQRLMNKGMSLAEIVEEHLTCYRMQMIKNKGDALKQLNKTLDQIAGADMFSQLLDEMHNKPGYPTMDPPHGLPAYTD